MNKDTISKDRMVYEDEIDLRELFKTIAKSKVFIAVFTMIVTIMAIIYAYSKTPIYEVKSVIKIGYITSVDKDGKSNKVFLENAKVLQEKLKLIYNVGVNKNSVLKNKAIVSNIKNIKGTNDFLEICTQGLSNELAINKAKEVISFIQSSYKNKIEYIKIKKNIEIKNLENQISYIKDVESKKYQREILKIKNQQIPQIDQKIKTIKNQQIPQIDQKIELVKNQQIPKVNREIELLKEVDLKNLENKIKFNKSKINKYEKMISEILKERTKSSTNDMIMSIQLFNMQNLILNLNKDNENLKKEKEYLLNIKLKDLYNQKDNILKVNLVNLYNQKDNILKINLVNLYNQKDNTVKDKIQSIKNKLKHELPKKILNLENKIKLTKLHLNNEIKNTTLVGDMLINDYPVKPKKRLIVAVAFVTSLILSIFLVFLINFIKGIKED